MELKIMNYEWLFVKSETWFLKMDPRNRLSRVHCVECLIGSSARWDLQSDGAVLAPGDLAGF